MPCYHPATAVRLRSGDVKFISANMADGESLTLPCGQCVGCRLEKSRQWAIRCLDEAQMHSENSFITLTFSPESVLKYGRSLDLSLFQKFMKCLRKSIEPKRVRFFHCGEYTKAFMPHFHALLFGHDWKDKVYWSMNGRGDKLYRSPTLEKLWNKGFSLIGDVTFESAAYVARYVLKKVVGDRDDKDRLIMKDSGEVLSPEYVTMSRRPGIGTSWFRKYMSDVYPQDVRVVRGRDMRPPKFYDGLYAQVDPMGFEQVRLDRMNSLDKKDNSALRLVVKEKVAIARLKLLPRVVEEVG